MLKQVLREIDFSTRTDVFSAGDAGAFANLIKVGNQVFMAGQVAYDLDGNWLDIEDPGGQARQTLSNIRALLAEVGGTMGDVVKMTVYVTDRSYRPAVYREINAAFGGHSPCSTGIIVPGLASEKMLVEIDITAVIGSSGGR